MTGYVRDDDAPFAFLDSISTGSQDQATAMWHGLITDNKPLQEELQLRNPKVIPVDLQGEPIEYWVLASSQPEIGPDGQIRYVYSYP